MCSTVRSVFFRARLVRPGGQANSGMSCGENRPLTWRRCRDGGQGVVSSVVRMVDCGRRRETSFVSLWRARLRLEKAMGSPTSERSRWRRLRHLESAGRLFVLRG
jgi:hypothetical protein